MLGTGITGHAVVAGRQGLSGRKRMSGRYDKFIHVSIPVSGSKISDCPVPSSLSYAAARL